MKEDNNSNMIVPAFTRTHLDEDLKGKTRDILTISLNLQERQIIEQFKKDSRIPHDSKAIKVLMEIGASVVLSPLMAKSIKYISSRDRTATNE